MDYRYCTVIPYMVCTESSSWLAKAPGDNLRYVFAP